MIFVFFENTTQEAAYILGFIFADGYLHQKSYAVIIENIEADLENILYIFKKVGKWTITRRARINRQAQMRIQFSNRHIFKFLVDNGYMSRELGANKILAHIPVELHKDFFRGYFDGDGCFPASHYKI